ncbi:WYL domain-containing transcriptional regulator [bacterium]|nr:WYL domain-containing transcriptional regulator [bacterium]
MINEKPRYSRVSDILDLAIFMSSKLQGVTISEIAERYNVSRRTAERMRDSLICIFPQVDEIETDDNQKHWGFINYSISQLVNFTPKELANIEQLQRRTTNHEMKEELSKTLEKLKTINRKNMTSIENNIELFMQTEGYAVRQMPQYKINIQTIDIIRNALQQSKMVEGIYHDKKRLIEPLGMIYGEKIYLVAREKAKGDGIYNYLLHKFSDLKLTDKTFDKGDFNLQEYTNQSFGVYHGEILDVKLSFAPEIAKEAKEFNFHPTQKMKEEKDGSLTVTFKASGNKEIIWHVFRWGAGCKIIAPKSLKDEYKKYLADNLGNY